MKKVLLIAIALLIFQEWAAINNYLNPPPTLTDANGGSVILYTIP